MRCRQLLSLSVTLATVLVLVKCETPSITSPAKEKASSDQQEDTILIDKHSTTLDTSSKTENTVTTPAATTKTVKITTYTPATKGDEPTTATKDEPTTATKGDEPTTAKKGDEPTTATKGDEKTTTTIKPTMQVTTTTANPQNSTSSALTALSAVTLCVLSLTVSL